MPRRKRPVRHHATPPKKRDAKTSQPLEPLLNVHAIQGNILTGFNKDHQQLIALKIRNVEDTRRWLIRVLPSISSLFEVHQFNALYKARRVRFGQTPHGLIATWMNLAFSREGIAKLTSSADADALPDSSFRQGLGKDRAEFLGDPVPEGEGDPTARWLVGGTGRVPDILMIVAGDDPVQLASEIIRLRPGLKDGSGAPETMWEEKGEVLHDQPGHEHFGFKDGVSQPGVRGLISRKPKIYLTPRFLKRPADGSPEFSKPGQPLVWPGHFVLGYPFGDRSNGSRRDALPLARPWFKDGSFLVFRRLNQNVSAFKAFLVAEAARLARQPVFAGMTPERLGALIVGRWPSGAPFSRTPNVDNTSLANNDVSNNDFVFTVDTPPPDFLPKAGISADNFPRAMEGTHGPVCPRGAHIFKVNPRDQSSDVGSSFDTLTRRILRRGIPFGPSHPDPLRGDDGVERGLHFLCYQASIVDQFEFIQQDWANNSGAPTAGGHDLIIGQPGTPQRSLDLPAIASGNGAAKIETSARWVTPTGGGYFFAPSIPAIRTVLSRE